MIVKKDITTFYGESTEVFIACLGYFRVIKIIKSTIQMAINATIV